MGMEHSNNSELKIYSVKTGLVGFLIPEGRNDRDGENKADEIAPWQAGS